MAADLKTATSAIPGSQLAPTQLTTLEATIYTCPSGAAFLGKLYLTNVTGSAATAFVSLIKVGGASGAGNRIIGRSLAAGETAVLSVQLNDGDFLSGLSGTATAVTVVLDGTVFSNSTGTTLSGIQDDAIGTSGATGSNKIGTASNRRLLAALRVVNTAGGFAGYATYDTLLLGCTDGAMTLLVSANYDYGGGATGSIHLFERANPSSGSTQIITPNVTKAGFTLTPIVESMSLSGVGSVTGAVTDAPTSSSAVNLAVTSAVGHRPVFAVGTYDPPIGFNQRVRGFNGIAPAFSYPAWLTLADALGAATVTATTSNATYHAAVGIDLVPA